MTGSTATSSTTTSLAPSRAARELGLKRSEFDLAVHLGRIRTVRDEGGGRVAREEIERLRAGKGFPDGLRKRVEAVGTKDGAAIVDVTPSRFTRLARLGLIVPVKFYLNRYRAVVWLYLAEELRQFAAEENNAPLLSGRTPEGLRSQLAAGVDLRPRNWRGRHLGFLLRQADGDPWARAAAVTCLLDPVQVTEIVKDPCERAYLSRLRPRVPTHGAPGSPSAALAHDIMTARDPDEIGWLRADLARALDEARHHRPAPRPAAKPDAAGPQAKRHAAGAAQDTTEPEQDTAVPDRPRGLRGWLRRRGTRPTAP
ncbi:DUF6397 family protein [Streptomyces sp. DH24]|uniref:DUF6397 family protein n=1 Tax=Streptomyces sp. DH24 TaxID=3040123 RepID=UPI002442FF1E|nr:DUF6397 family protein [Streptomyces sp. DH24]MDG9715590.1 DUF6397 family protein [Streptomyces sp. DH24]